MIAIVCVAAFLVGRSFVRRAAAENPRPLGPAAVTAKLQAAAQRPDLAAPEGATERSGAIAPMPNAADAKPEPAGDEGSSEPEMRHQAW
ncbi:MAG TPA: hypothetical protein VMT18_07540, partial [Planctomycetota bacterium]|nr:hypothetical protein [Planctomycetota bacterium]